MSERPDKPRPEPLERCLGFPLQIFRAKKTPEYFKRHTGQITVAPCGIPKTEAVLPVVKAANQLTENFFLLRRDHLVFRAAFPVLQCLQRLKDFQKLFVGAEIRSNALLFWFCAGFFRQHFFRFFLRFGCRFFRGGRFWLGQTVLCLLEPFPAARQYQENAKERKNCAFFHRKASFL